MSWFEWGSYVTLGVGIFLLGIFCGWAMSQLWDDND